jgi:hypothetical protein
MINLLIMNLICDAFKLSPSSIALPSILVYVCSRPPEMTSALEVRCFTTAPL